MDYCRKLKNNKNNVNCYSLNRLLILVFTMILMFETYSISTLETESSNTSCSNALTCTKCTIKDQCQWSLKKQKCTKKIFKKFSSLTASTLGECPQFSVDKQYNYYFTFFSCFIDLKYIVKVSNDLVGFVDYLRTSNIYLQRTLNFENRYNRGIINNTIIFTLGTEVSISMADNTSLSNTEFLFIKFNNVALRFNNVADHYVTFDIRHHKCIDDEKDKFCATCAWNYNGYSNYLKWCSNDNVCGGQKHLYLKNNTEDIISKKSLIVNQQIEEAYVTNDCPEVNVTAVNPLFGPHTGGTEVTIIVTNHRIFVESQSIQMMVMVAGMVCMNPRTSGPETITCTTSPWVNVKGEPPTPGPILVKYSSYLGRLTIESSQRFQYDARPTCGSPNPVLDTNQRLRSLESGDIAVPVRGVHFVKPCVVSTARLFVVLPNGAKQFASSYCDIPVNDTYMVCRSPRVDSRVWPDRDLSIKQRFLNFGLNVMNLIGNQSFFVEGPSHGFKVLIDPVLVDFNVIKSNGSVVFNGRYLNHFQSDVILIRLPNSSATGCESALDCVVVACCENVMFSRQHIICHPNVTIAPAATASRNILVTIGDRLLYTVPNRSLPPVKPSTSRPERWRGIVSLSTCLFVVCVLAFYLRTKNQYSLTETDGDPPMASTRS